MLVNVSFWGFFGHFAENKYDFYPASINLLAELLKLLFCSVVAVWVVVRGNPSRHMCVCVSCLCVTEKMLFFFYLPQMDDHSEI